MEADRRASFIDLFRRTPRQDTTQSRSPELMKATAKTKAKALALMDENPNFIEHHRGISVINLESIVNEGDPVEAKIILNPKDELVRIFVSDPYPKYSGDEDKKWETYTFRDGYCHIESMRRNHTLQGRISLDWKENVSFLGEDKLEKLLSILNTAEPYKTVFNPGQEKNTHSAWRRVNNACLDLMETYNGSLIYQGGPKIYFMLNEEDRGKLPSLNGGSSGAGIDVWEIIERDDVEGVFDIRPAIPDVLFEVNRWPTVTRRELMEGLKVKTHVLDASEMTTLAEVLRNSRTFF